MVLFFGFCFEFPLFIVVVVVVVVVVDVDVDVDVDDDGDVVDVVVVVVVVVLSSFTKILYFVVKGIGSKLMTTLNEKSPLEVEEDIPEQVNVLLTRRLFSLEQR